MTKSIRFLMVLTFFLVIIIFSLGIDLHQTIAEVPTPTFKVVSTAIAAPVAVFTDEPTRQKNLVLIEFFSGL
jgi:hypothetical protein